MNEPKNLYNTIRDVRITTERDLFREKSPFPPICQLGIYGYNVGGKSGQITDVRQIATAVAAGLIIQDM